MNAEYIAAITQAVIRQLQMPQAGTTNTIALTDEVLRSRLATPSSAGVIRRSSSSASSESLGRSSSTASASSLASSASSLVSARAASISSFAASANSEPRAITKELNFGHIEDQVHKKRRVRRGCPEENAIVDAITRPVMEQFDTKYLAVLETPLFKRMLKKARNPNGTRSLKNHKSMVMPLFRKLVRPVIRRILGRLETPNASRIYTKYYRMAIKIVKKRRANHVQSWRVYGTPENLIYGSIPPPERDLHNDTPQRRSDTPQQRDDATQQRSIPAPARNLQQRRSDTPRRRNGHESDGHDCDDELRDGHKSDGHDRDDELRNDQESGDDHDREWREQCESERDSTFCCPDCKKEFPIAKGFPRDEGSAWLTHDTPRCRPCWTATMNADVLPLVVNPKERKNMTTALTGKKRKATSGDGAEGKKRKATSGDGAGGKKRKRRTRRTQCKCGSTTHVSVRHGKCPLNKKNATQSQVTVDENTDAGAADENTDTVRAADENTDAVRAADENTDAGAADENTDAGAADENTDAVDETLTFQLGSNVLAKWGQSRMSWFLSHVCGVHGLGQFAKYDVYCPAEDVVKKNLDSTKVRVFDNTNVPTRADYVKDNATFSCDGETWKVRAVCHELNQFKCVRVSHGGTGPNMDDFEIGYVIRQIPTTRFINDNEI